MNVLFVCTGNICRSSVAEYLLRDGLERNSGVTVTSAGTSGMTGYPMDPRSLEYLAGRGVDGSGFTARRVDRHVLKDADLVVGLEKSHVDHCLRLAPAMLKRTFRLHQLAEWHRGGELTSLTQLPHQRNRLPRVTHDHTDPVGFSSTGDYDRLLDDVAADVSAVVDLLSH